MDTMTKDVIMPAYNERKKQNKKKERITMIPDFRREHTTKRDFRKEFLEKLKTDSKEHWKKDDVSADTSKYGIRNDFAQSIFNYSISMFQRTYEGKNLVMSPLLAAASTWMLRWGAAGDTRSQIDAALMGRQNKLMPFFGHDSDQTDEELSDFYNTIFEGCGMQMGGSNTGFHLSNELYFYMNKNIKILDTYRKRIQECPFLKLRELPLEGKTDQTDFSDLRIRILSRLSFYGEWSSGYEEGDIWEDIFESENGKRVLAEFMHGRAESYLSDGYATGFIKSYKGGRYFFLALLPQKGISLQDYIQMMSGRKLADIIRSRRLTEVKTAIPKFEQTCSVDVKSMIEGIGVTDLFDLENADFSHLCAGNPETYVFVKDFVQDVCVGLNEKGVKPFLKNQLHMNGYMPGTEPHDKYAQSETYYVNLNRPFLYVIYDKIAMSPLLIGAVTD